MKFINNIAMLASLLLLSCGGGSDDSPTPPTPEQVVPDPKAATLIFPGNNTECNEGVVIDALKSRVTFQWNASEDTDTYEVNVRNISSNQTSTTNVSTEESAISLDRGTPYEWFITSKAMGTNVTASSAKFKFYNQGPGIENYAPFPAEVVSPTRGAEVTNSSGSVTLEWKGTDIDNDIEAYEVFFGTNETPTESQGITSETSFDVEVTVDTIYYWSIVIFDTQGNSSQSEIFEFKVSS